MNIKQEVLPQGSRFDNPFHKRAMELHKNAKSLENMPPEKHGLSPEEHETRLKHLMGKHHEFMSKFYNSVGHEYMKGLHAKKAKDFLGEDYDEFQTESDVSHKQKMMDYALKASDKVVYEAKEFATGKLESTDKIQRRLHFIKKALDQVNKNA